MYFIEAEIRNCTENFIKQHLQEEFTMPALQIEKTPKEFEGDFTLVFFPLLKLLKRSPEQIGNELGNYIKDNLNIISSFNVIKGFLNFSIHESFWIDFLKQNVNDNLFGFSRTKKDKKIVIEFSSPNTNKPLHLGHIRNNLLGYSLSEIFRANGYKVIRTNLINDRGIHICKTMYAWQRWSNGETPESTGIKGDHLVGRYYVLFEQKLKEELQTLMQEGKSEEEARKCSRLLNEAQQLLQRWEDRDLDVIKLWKMMNQWVYDGFDATYTRMGIHFDKIDYESQTYLEGKKYILQALQKGIVKQKEDGSIWIDLTAEGLDEKLLLRSDGTSVYITQDIGTAILRYNEHQPDEMIYVVGNEQEYHFNVLKKILSHFGFNWADRIIHYSYGMVELPEGRMKSREGKVVDADDLMDEMINTAREISKELGKIEGLSGISPKYKDELFATIGLGALKYHLLKVDPKKNITFNPDESIDFNGNTGPFIQYTYARIQSLKRKSASLNLSEKIEYKGGLNNKEKSLIRMLYDFPETVRMAAQQLSPALIANYVYELAKEYNQFYQEIPVLKAESDELIHFRLKLSEMTGIVIKNAMKLLGADVPEIM